MKTFVENLWTHWTGHAPTESELLILEACFSLCIDNGAESPSAIATARAHEEKQNFAACVMAGLATLGPVHGNAGSAAARNWIAAVAEQISPAEFISRHAIVPGLGHRIYTIDERSEKLYALATAHLKSTKHFDFARAAAAELSAQKRKPLPLNIDGALGAVIADFGAAPELADAIFLVARSGGLAKRAF